MTLHHRFRRNVFGGMPGIPSIQKLYSVRISDDSRTELVFFIVAISLCNRI